jgi:hypothetical protein
MAAKSTDIYTLCPGTTFFFFFLQSHNKIFGDTTNI